MSLMSRWVDMTRGGTTRAIPVMIKATLFLLLCISPTLPIPTNSHTPTTTLTSLISLPSQKTSPFQTTQARLTLISTVQSSPCTTALTSRFLAVFKDTKWLPIFPLLVPTELPLNHLFLLQRGQTTSRLGRWPAKRRQCLRRAGWL